MYKPVSSPPQSRGYEKVNIKKLKSKKKSINFFLDLDFGNRSSLKLPLVVVKSLLQVRSLQKNGCNDTIPIDWGTLQSCRNNGNSGLCPDYGHVSFRSVSKVDVGLLRGGSFVLERERVICIIQASASQATVADEASAPSSATTSEANMKTNVPLTTKGVEATVQAGK